MKETTHSSRPKTVIGVKVRSRHLPTWFTEIIRVSLNRLFGFTQFNELYYNLPEHDNIGLSGALLDALNIKLELLGEPLNSYPDTEPLLFVANHPYGLADGLALDHLITPIRTDAKMLGMYVLRDIPEFHNRIFLVDPLKKRSRQSLNSQSWRQAYKLVSSGGALVVFPGASVSRYQWDRKMVADKDWSPHVSIFARRTKATVVPIFIHGRNSLWFQFLGLISYTLQFTTLFNEFMKLKGRTLSITFGKPIPAESWQHISDNTELTNYFRAHTDALSQS